MWFLAVERSPQLTDSKKMEISVIQPKANEFFQDPE